MKKMMEVRQMVRTYQEIRLVLNFYNGIYQKNNVYPFRNRKTLRGLSLALITQGLAIYFLWKKVSYLSDVEMNNINRLIKKNIIKIQIFLYYFRGVWYHMDKTVLHI